MSCKEEECGGTIDQSVSVALQTGCAATAAAFPCNRCGRLHWGNGNLVFNRQGEAAFLVDGVVELKEAQPTE